MILEQNCRRRVNIHSGSIDYQHSILFKLFIQLFTNKYYYVYSQVIGNATKHPLTFLYYEHYKSYDRELQKL